MNRGIVIKRILLISIGVLILTGATIHLQGGCKIHGEDGIRMDRADSPGKGEFR